MKRSGFKKKTDDSSKECRQCGKSFIPFQSAQVVCSPVCARRYVNTKKKEEIARTRERKQAIKTIPDLIKEAQIAFNRWVRARDEKQPCISCGKPPGDMSALHAGRDAGHFRSTGAAPHVRFHEDNCHSQCVSCNQWKAGNAVDYRIGLVRRIGVERVESLESNNEVHKWTREELIEIKLKYVKKLKELKSESKG